MRGPAQARAQGPLQHEQQPSVALILPNITQDIAFTLESGPAAVPARFLKRNDHLGAPGWST